MVRDPFAANDQYGIRPHWVYRKHHPETLKILGYGPTKVDEEIANGTLPRPAPLTSHGRALGWMGWQLIEVAKRRLAAAAERPLPKTKKTRGANIAAVQQSAHKTKKKQGSAGMVGKRNKRNRRVA